jgi:hypothetical protein
MSVKRAERWRLLLGVVFAVGLSLAVPATSGATMPGTNGRIAFTKGVEPEPFKFEVDLWSMNPDGSGAAQLTTGDDASDGAYSADGSRFAFDRYNEVWIATADGSGARAIAVGSEQHTTATRWVANYEDPETSTVYPWVKVVEQREDRDFRSQPAFSPDGKALAVNHFSGTYVVEFICSVNAKNDESCNGTYNDFESDCEGCGSSIEAIDPDTGAVLATLVPRESGAYLSAPAYSSSGTLAYTREPEGDVDNNEIRIVPAPGSGSVLLVKGQVREPDFSPDGSRVAFNSGRHDIGIVAAAGGTPTFFSAPPPVPTNEVWFTRNPVWSPDGSLIAFGNAGGTGGFGLLTDGGVYLVHPDGSSVIQIQADATAPSSWQPIPIPPPPPPPIRARALKGKKKLKLNRKGVATVTKIVCGSSPCPLKATKAKLKVGKKRYGVKALIAKSLAAGATTQLRIKVKGKALTALESAHHGRLLLALAVTDVTGTQVLSFKPKILPPAKRHKMQR